MLSDIERRLFESHGAIANDFQLRIDQIDPEKSATPAPM